MLYMHYYVKIQIFSCTTFLMHALTVSIRCTDKLLTGVGSLYKSDDDIVDSSVADVTTII